MADTAKPKRVGREESDPVDAFGVHHFEASLSVGGHLKKILTTGFRNEPQWKPTCRAIAAGTVAVLEPRGSGHNFTQGRIQITQPNIIRFRHMRVGVNNVLCPQHLPPPSCQYQRSLVTSLAQVSRLVGRAVILEFRSFMPRASYS